MFLVYKNIPKGTIEGMLQEQNGSKRQVLLENAIKTSYTGIHKDIFYEFHFDNLNFCLSNSFTSEKTSCLLEIFKQVFDRALSERLSESQSFEIFKSLLLKHSVQRSPRSIAVFTVAEVKKVVEYALVSYFRHFSLYTYAFLPNCNLSLKNVNRFEGVFPMILRLEEGAEIIPETIPALDEYIIKPVIEEQPRELDSEEEEALITDPLQYLLEKELKQIKTELDEKIKKQDEEFLAKIEVFKK